MIEFEIRLFGAFRKYGEKVVFSLPAGASVHDIKNKLASELKLSDPALINDSAIANDNEIIGADAVFTMDSRLAILPPVCGG